MINWLKLINERLKYLFVEFTTIKIIFLAAITYGFFIYDHFESWAYVILVCSVLGLREAKELIEAFRGVNISGKDRTEVVVNQQG